MKRSDQMKQQRSSIIQDWDQLVEKVNGENRSFTEDENTSIQNFRDEVKRLDAQIEAQMDLEARKAASAAASGQSIDSGEGAEKKKIKERFSVIKMIRTAMDGRELTGAEKEVEEIAQEENRNAGISFDDGSTSKRRLHLPMSFVRATQQTVSQDSGDYGGQLVQEGTPQVVMGLEPKLMIEQLGARVLTGLTGGSIKMPVGNSYPFEWLAEGANITGQKGTFTGPTLTPKRAGAAVSLTNRLLMQSSVSADMLVMDLLRKGWGNAINAAAINGAGGVAPTGILNTAGINTAADVAAAAATFAKIVELQGLIEEDDSTEVSPAYLLHPRLKAALKTKTKDAGSGRFILEGSELDGYQYVSTSLVPVGDDGGTAVYPLIFGDFSQLYVANWGSFSFLLNPYSEDLADSVRITVNTHADVAIANPEAFAANSFLTTA